MQEFEYERGSFATAFAETNGDITQFTRAELIGHISELQSLLGQKRELIDSLVGELQKISQIASGRLGGGDRSERPWYKDIRNRCIEAIESTDC